MPDRFKLQRTRPETFVFLWLIGALFVVLWIAGGASRADAFGQFITRAASWGVVIAALLISARANVSPSPAPARLLAAAIVLMGFQLVPLPPAVWMALPGRETLTGSATILGAVQPWRPLSLSPAGTLNALGSLIVPLAVLMPAVRLEPRQQWVLLSLILGLVFAASVVATLEFSGVRYDNPFLNDRLDHVNGSFANRNHFALFAALGVMLAPVWGLRDPVSRWRPLAALGMVPLFLVVVLATGSRSGALLAVSALAVGLWLTRAKIRTLRRRLPARVFWGIAAAGGALLVGALGASIALDRAVSVDRAAGLEASDDVRVRTLPIVINMVKTYFPVGSGFGTFDPAFRIAESSEVLRPQYLNAAHNDLVQVVLEGGVFGLALLLIALAWWAKASLRAWRSGPVLAQVGSAIIGLSVLASITDYPARTPMMMAIIIVAAVWLSRTHDLEQTGKPLPKATASL